MAKNDRSQRTPSDRFCERLRRSLRIERLEQRTLLASITWDGGGDAVRWHDPLNWDTDSIPAVEDDVIIESSLGVNFRNPIAISEPVTVHSLQSNTSLMVAAADVVIESAFALEHGFTLEVTQGSFLVTGETAVDGTGLIAIDGGSISMPGISAFRNPKSARFPTLRAEGAGSLLDLQNVIDINMNAARSGSKLSIEALNGGQVDLRSVASIRDPITGSNNFVNVVADGNDSLIDLSSLERFIDADAIHSTNRIWSTSIARNGGTIRAERLRELYGVRLIVDGTGTQTIDQISSVGFGELEIRDGQVHQLDQIDDLKLTSLIIDGGTHLIFPNVDRIDSASIVVKNGSSVSLPEVRSLTHISTERARIQTLRAEGVGSTLNLGSIESIRNGSEQSAQLYIEAIDGGTIDLSRVNSITESDYGNKTQRAFHLLADGNGSRVELGNLTKLIDVQPAQIPGGGGISSSIIARNGGTIDAANLSELHGTKLVLDGTGTQPVSQISSLRLSELELSGGGVFDFSKITDLTLAIVTLRDGTTANFENVISIDSANIVVESGSQLAFPAVRDIVHRKNTFGRTSSFRAVGDGSILDLSRVTEISVVAPDPSRVAPLGFELVFEAAEGGRIDLSNTISISESNVSNSTQWVRLLADGPGSVVDLSSLNKFTDVDFRRAKSISTLRGLVSSSEARNGGAILAPKLTELRGIHLILDDSGTQDWSQIEVFDRGQLSFTGGEYDVTSISDLSLSYIVASDGARVTFRNVQRFDSGQMLVQSGANVAFPALNELAHYSQDSGIFTSELHVEGAGSVLDLSQVKTIHHGGERGTKLSIEASSGALVNFGGVTTISETDDGMTGNRNVTIVANGAGSVVDFSSLTTFVHVGTGRTSSIIERNGGTVAHDNLVYAPNVLIQKSARAALPRHRPQFQPRLPVDQDMRDLQPPEPLFAIRELAPPVGGMFRWIGGDGDWFDATNWDRGIVPTEKSDVMIDVPQQDVTVNIDQTDVRVRSIQSTESLSITRAKLTVEDESQLNGVTLLRGSELIAEGPHASLLVNGKASLPDGSLLAIAGGTLTLPTLSQYAYAGIGGRFFSNNRQLAAVGPGSQLNLPNVAEITFGETGGLLDILAKDGGSVDLSGAVRIFEQEPGGNTNAIIRVRAEGFNSVIDFDSLQRFTDWDADHPARAWSSMVATEGGKIDAEQLTELSRVNLIVDVTGDQPISQISVFNRGLFEFVGRSTHSINNITDLSRSTIAARDRATVTFDDVTNLEGANLEATDGSSLSFPNVKLLMNTSNFSTADTRYVRAVGLGSEIKLENVETVSVSGRGVNWEIEAVNGGRIDLRRVHSISAPDEFNNRNRSVTVKSHGEGSQIDLSLLTRFVDEFFDSQSVDGTLGTWSVMFANNGGKILGNRLEELIGVHLLVDGTGSHAISQITRFDRGHLELASRQEHVFTRLTDLTLSLITVASQTSASFPMISELTSVSVTVKDRSSASFPSSTALTHSLNEHGVRRDFQVIGPDSILKFPNVQSIANGDLNMGQWNFGSYGGGLIDLGQVTSIVGSSAGLSTEQSINLQADGERSIIDLGSLSQFTDSSMLDRANRNWSQITARNGATIKANRLIDVEGIRVILDGTGILPVFPLESTRRIQLELSNGHYDFSKVSDLSGATIDVAGPNTSVVLENVTNLDGASITVREGATAAFPAVTSITHVPPTSSSNPVLRAIGPQSVLDLTNVTSITNSTDAFSALDFEAIVGGRVDLSSVRSVEDPAGDQIQGRAVRFKADGADSVIDVSSLREFVNLANSEIGQRSMLTAAHLGRINARKSASHFENVDVMAGEIGTIDGGIVLHKHSVLSGAGRVFGDVTNNGKVSPDGQLSVVGNFIQTADGQVEFDIDGTNQGNDYDWLAVTGYADLQGSLSIAPPGSFIPSDGDDFQVLTFENRVGGFDRFLGMNFDGKASFLVDLDSTKVTLAAGPPTNADRLEPNDSAATATMLDTNEQVLSELTIHRFDDEDWFEWNPTVGGLLVVKMESDSRYGDTDLAVYDEQQRLIAASRTEFNDERIAIPVLSGESFFFQVEAYAHAIPNYALSIELLPDADGDGLPNDWETDGVDINGDGIVDYALPEANPNRADLYIEIDAMVGRAPIKLATPPRNVVDAKLETQTVIDRVIEQFLNAPFLNPDGTTGIHVHATIDESDIPLSPFARWSDFTDVRNGQPGIAQGHFGTPRERSLPNWSLMREAKSAVYRYGLFADRILNSRSSGIAETPGTSFAITLGSWETPGGTEDEQAGTFMHELGHTLGLRHGGGDDVNFKPNYFSVMNYHWQIPLAGNTGWQIGYSDGSRPTLDESRLDENVGMGYSRGNIFDTYQLQIGPPFVPQSLVDPVDWNRNGQIDPEPVQADVNRGFADSNHDGFVNASDQGDAGQLLHDHEDWANLRFVFTGPADLRKYRDGFDVSPWTDDIDPSDMYDVDPPDKFDENDNNDTRDMAVCIDESDEIATVDGKTDIDGATIHDPFDIDWFKLLAPFSGFLDLDFVTLFAGIGQLFELQVSNADEQVLGTLEQEFGNDEQRMSIDVQAGQTYYFRVSGIDDAQGVYELGIEFLPKRDEAFLSDVCSAIMANDIRGDVDGNGSTNQSDWDFAVHDIMRTFFGDANLDGIFDSGDLVLVFQGGQYEDQIVGNSTWSTGDWNCDGEFTTADLVVAFQEGVYEAAPVVAGGIPS